MNEPFLLSNLIDLQEIDNKLFKLIESKSSSENVNKLKDLEIEFKDLTSNISGQINSLEKYFSISLKKYGYIYISKTKISGGLIVRSQH